MFEQGSGEILLFLHPGFPSGRIVPADPVVSRLAENFRVICPTHPGFGRQDAPRWMTTIDDLAYFYLDVLLHLDLKQVVLVGASLGAWIAAEIAVKSTERLCHLVLVNPVGIKVGDREDRDIVDIFSLVPSELIDLTYHDPANGHVDYAALDEEELFYAARSREATARYGWSPYLHDPKLKRRLHRIDVPTMVLSGESDRLVRAGYGEAFSEAIPGAVFSPIHNAGHYPHHENPEQLADQIATLARRTSTDSHS